MGRETTKTTLLEAGKKLFLEKGYNHAGIEAILQEAGVPKGSFYHFFESKEDFGLQVIDHFASAYEVEIERHLGDEALSPLDRLRDYYEVKCVRLQSQECRGGCLAGKLSQEMADQSEAFRDRLDTVFRRWVDRHAECLKQAQAAGELSPDIDPRELAEFWLSSWQGAVLRAKTIRSTAPLRTFLNVMFRSVLQPA
ncbi:MAG TPA: TetR family transcriptional regulator C-terminal domain-containing protein [Isosphaeraceae bacterium]|jgi:TetR/AcrR family transcriptional repressor of nem operon|nr:TetR family transcriptional regulator C-terminal domain-containing protein [Isosphaeraceae bacterium]